jgi:4-hydroxybenzoate polyprenyltransferase
MLALVIGMYITGVTWFAWTEAKTSSAQELTGAAAVMLAGVLLSLTLPALIRHADLDENSWVDWRRIGALLFPYLLVIFIFVVAAPIRRAIADPVPERVQAAVKRTILGLVLLDAILATALAGPIGLAIILLLVPARILGRWAYST